MKDQRKAEEIAMNRVQLLSPLLASGLDAAKANQIKAEICAAQGISERTLRRYLAQYREGRFEGLKPKPRGRKPSPETITPQQLEEAVLLRREVPGRSIRQIIQILVWEGKAKPGEIKRSTLQEKLSAKGYSSRQMRLYTSQGAAARRFQRRHRNALWQSDIKFGPHLPIGLGGQKKPVYLVLFIDDATRFVVHGAFYDTLEKSIVEDCFRQAIARHGVPEAVIFVKAGCISFMGKQYEVGLLFIGRTVQVVYDPADVREVTIEYDGHAPWAARELIIGEQTGKRPALPEYLGKETADTSRLLRGAEAAHTHRKETVAPAVSYSFVRKEGGGHV